MKSQKENRECRECWAISQELAKASQAINQEAQRKLRSSGKSLQEAHEEWILATTDLFKDEYRIAEWNDSQPALTEARRKKAAHEATTGHSIFLALPWSR